MGKDLKGKELGVGICQSCNHPSFGLKHSDNASVLPLTVSYCRCTSLYYAQTVLYRRSEH